MHQLVEDRDFAYQFSLVFECTFTCEGIRIFTELAPAAFLERALDVSRNRSLRGHPLNVIADLDVVVRLYTCVGAPGYEPVVRLGGDVGDLHIDGTAGLNPVAERTGRRVCAERADGRGT